MFSRDVGVATAALDGEPSHKRCVPSKLSFINVLTEAVKNTANKHAIIQNSYTTKPPRQQANIQRKVEIAKR